MLHVLNVEDVEDVYSSGVYLIQKQEKDDDWVEHVSRSPAQAEATEAISCCKMIFY